MSSAAGMGRKYGKVAHGKTMPKEYTERPCGKTMRKDYAKRARRKHMREVVRLSLSKPTQAIGPPWRVTGLILAPARGVGLSRR